MCDVSSKKYNIFLMMDEFKYQEIIQNTIEQIRKRKSRPDFDRIFKFINRKYGIPLKDVEDEISRLVERNIIYKVEYRGQISYRNKTQKLGRIFNSKPQNPTACATFTNVLIKALKDLLSIKNNLFEEGISVEELYEYLETRFPDSGFTIDDLKSALSSEVSTTMKILKLSTGNYTLNNDFIPSESSYANVDINNENHYPNESPAYYNVSLKVLSENLSSYNDHTAILAGTNCNICQGSVESNDKVLICYGCHFAQAHLHCLDNSFKDNKEWLCYNCRVCHRICCICESFGSAKGDPMLLCSVCDRVYHIRCHWPQVTQEDSVKTKWACGQCTFRENITSNADLLKEVCSTMSSQFSYSSQINSQVDRQNINMNTESPCNLSMHCEIPTAENNQTARLQEDSEANFLAILSSCHANKISLKNYPNYVPDVRQWTADDVEYFVSCIGFPREAQLLRFHEIDGIALLLMERSDILSVLNIKLGPALKLYRHIVHLQSAIRASIEPAKP